VKKQKNAEKGWGNERTKSEIGSVTETSQEGADKIRPYSQAGSRIQGKKRKKEYIK